MGTLKKLVLHIGQTKTATTSLQFFLSNNKKHLQTQGITYLGFPGAGQQISHRYVYNLLTMSTVTQVEQKEYHRERLQRFFPESSAQVQFDSEEFLIDSLQNCSTETGLFSEELFWHLGEFDQGLRRSCLHSLKGLLQKGAPDAKIKIIAYLRPQDSWLESWHNQLLKDRYLQVSIQQMLARHIKLGAYNYAQIIGDWLEIIHPEEVVIRPFLQNALRGNSIYDDFVANGLDLVPSSSYTIPSGKLQVSLHPAVCAYVIRNRPATDGDYKTALQNMSDFAKQYKPFQNVKFTLLKDEEREELRQIVSGWNENLSMRFNLDTDLSDSFLWGKTQVPLPLPHRMRKRFQSILRRAAPV